LWGNITFAAGLDESAGMLPLRVPTWSCRQGKGRRYYRLQELLPAELPLSGLFFQDTMLQGFAALLSEMFQVEELV